jgi:glycosyltransferase involved in cell wall biosynthesis
MNRHPRLSVIVCIYNMVREAPRTILSAAIPYQKGVEPDDYEIILVDNGSTRPLPDTVTNNLPSGVRMVSMPNPHPSPVFAMNWAAREFAKGEILMFAIDGARIFSDGLYAATIAAHDIVQDAFVYTFAWHLGPKVQSVSTQEGYNTEVEDQLIAESGWPERPRALFGICAQGASCREGYFKPIGGSNAFSMPRKLFDRIGGYDERFVSPGAGLANREIFERYVTRPKAVNICLLAEGSFHQVHGGAATSCTFPPEYFRDEYREIFGKEHRRPEYQSLYYASGGKEFLQFINMPAQSKKPPPGLASRVKSRLRKLAQAAWRRGGRVVGRLT